MKRVLVVAAEVVQMLGRYGGVPMLEPAAGTGSFLTDTLESQHALPNGCASAQPSVLLCIGNPPYDRQHIDPSDAGTSQNTTDVNTTNRKAE